MMTVLTMTTATNNDVDDDGDNALMNCSSLNYCPSRQREKAPLITRLCSSLMSVCQLQASLAYHGCQGCRYAMPSWEICASVSSNAKDMVIPCEGCANALSSAMNGVSPCQRCAYVSRNLMILMTAGAAGNCIAKLIPLNAMRQHYNLAVNLPVEDLAQIKNNLMCAGS